ncbi:DUF1972 domain-containing protein [uncultured Alistipes sp.]|jgi:hypothetical protein|uniref:DUF1972 domain-containing protein n=1 Tax=uncultured Alistipes sp. TaxID=538949 RepID=UPI0025FDB882|nr:DUF1972 domain-containing protein [uncultured Alistipes sp.]
MKRIAVIGIQGVPAGYGGFETLVEHIIGENSSPEVAYTVYCSSRGLASRPKAYKGAVLRYIPLPANGPMSVLYDMIGLLRSMRGYDAILVLGVSGCLFLPVFRLFCRKKLIVNIDGLEHRRAKWGRFARWFLRISEKSAVKFSDIVVADNGVIRDYVRQTYAKTAVLVVYGGDHAVREVDRARQSEILRKYGLSSGRYAFSVCRIEPENNCHVTLEAFSAMGEKLLFIGNWNGSAYGRQLKEKYGACACITLPDPVYDLDELYVLRKHSHCYVHGHSAGGTNPSLVEAMFCGCNIFAYDCGYNRETTDSKAGYFRDAQELASLVHTTQGNNSSAMAEIARRRYVWADIARQYENLY